MRHDVRRVAAVALLAAAAALGLRARGATTLSWNAAAVSAEGAAIRDVLGILVLAGVLACAVLVTAAFSGRRKRRPRGEPRHVHEEPALPWWIRPATLLLVLAAAVVPFALLILQAHGHPQTSATPPSAIASRGDIASPTASLAPRSRARSGGSGGWPAATLIVLAVGAALLLFWRGNRPPGTLPTGAPAPVPPSAAPQSLARALAAGTAALGRGQDPRAAIIGCYAAMERSLAAAGSAPVAADTPAEVLARAASRGLVRSAAVGTLTSLFREARYSDHPLREADWASATEALARLRDEVGGDEVGGDEVGGNEVRDDDVEDDVRDDGVGNDDVGNSA
jgi:hypothetical protein